MAGFSLILAGVAGPAAAHPREPQPTPPAGVLRPPAVTGRDVPGTPPGPGEVLPFAESKVKAAPIPAAKRTRELTGRRTATTKFFALADGRVQAEVSPDQVHYRDKAGKWQDIDTKVAAATTPGFPYAVSRNVFASRFGDRSDRLVAVDRDGRGLTMGLDAPARAVRPAAAGDEVTYPAAAGGADLKYEVTASAVKESIVLSAPPSGAPTWRFVLGLDRVRAVPQADGSIALHAAEGEGAPLFVLPKPFMWDSASDPKSPNGQGWSSAVTQKISVENGRTILTVTADPAWLASKDRKYPVTVDPTIKIQPTLGAAQDVMINSYEPTVNYDNIWRLSAGSSDIATFRSLTRFDLGNVPRNTTLDSAQLQMYFDQVHGGDAADEATQVIEARRVTANWSETTANWSTMNTKFGEVGENSDQIDQAQTSRTSRVGSWLGATATDKSQAIAGDYLYNSDSKTGDNFTWVPRVTEAGGYEVQVHYVPGSNRATNAPYTVYHAGGSTTKIVNQTTGSGNGAWVSLGSFQFNAGTTHKVVLGDVAGKIVVADGVRLVKRAEATKQLHQTNAWHTFSVRSIVQSWLNGTQPNYGFMIKGKDEANRTGGPRYEAGDFSYGGEDDHGPKLLLTWGKPGVALNPVTTIRASGADLSWGAYTDPSSSPDDDIVEYQVHASKTQNFMPSAATLVAPVRPGKTTYNDTHATPTPANSSEPYGDQFFYMIAVKTRDGTVVPAQTEMVRLPKAGQVVKFVQAGAVDNTLTSKQPTKNWDVLDAGGELQVGNNGELYGTSRVVLKFPAVTGLPAKTKVVDAEVGLWSWYTEGGGTGKFQLRGLTRDFSETQSTWNSASSGVSWTTPGGDAESTVRSTVSPVTGDPGWTSFKAGPLVQNWVNDASTNKGVLVRLENESTPTQRVLFLSSEAAEPSLRPRLRIVYTAPDTKSTYDAPTTPGRMVPGDESLVPVTITNTTDNVWSPSDYELSYRWERADGTDVSNADNQKHTPLPSAQAPGGVVTVNATVKAPANSGDGDRREDYVLKWDVRNKTTGQWLSQSAKIDPLDQSVAVENPTSDQLGLEKFYQYTGGSTGSGSTVMVNQFSGNAVVGYNPLENPSRGVSTFARLTYNSQDTSDSGLGLGWSLSTSSTVRMGSPLEFRGDYTWPEQVAMTDGDGTTHTFKLDKHDSGNPADWRYLQPAGVHMFLQKTNDGDPTRAWTMTRPDRSQFVFDDDGYQQLVRDRNGNELEFTYEWVRQNNRTVKVLRYLTDPANRQTLTLDYYEAGDPCDVYVAGTRTTVTSLGYPRVVGRLKSMTDVSGRQIQLVYSDDGLLREITDGAGTAVAKVLGFAYDDATDRLIRVDDPRKNKTKIDYFEGDDAFTEGKVSTLTDRLNKITNVEYADPDGSASAGVITTVTDAKGRATENVIDGFGRVTRITNAKDEVTNLTWDADNNVNRLEEANHAVTTWRFDQQTGYPLEIKDPEANQNNTAPTRLDYRYGLSGHTAEVTMKVTPEGRRWDFGYDDLGNLTSVTDPKGTSTATAGDYTTSYTYDGFGQMQTETDANEHVTKYGGYDVVGYPTTITDPLNKVTTYSYSSIGSVLSQTDALNHKSEYTYDTFGRPLTTKVPKDSAAGRYITTPAPVYDKNDNVTEQTSPTGAVTKASYDAADQTSTTTEPKDNDSDPDRVTKYDYDQVGNVVKKTEPKGTLTAADTTDFTTSYVYDELNRVVQITDAAGGRATAGYDNVGNLVIAADQRKNATADANDFNVKYTFDLNHRQKTAIDAKGFTTKSEYDKDGNKTVDEDQDGNKTTTVFDERSALKERKVPHKSSGGTVTYRTTQYEYDEVGNQTRVISPRGVATADPDDFATVTLYDELNRKKEVQQPYSKTDVKFTTPAVTTYKYDDVGNLERISAPPSEGETARNDTVSAFFDNGWVKTSTDVAWNIVSTYDYDDNGAQTSRKVTSPGATAREMNWTYYPDGKKKSQADNGAGSASPRKDFRYEYDPNANLVKMLDQSTDAKIDNYAVSYDGLNRVASVEEKLGTTVKNTTTYAYEQNDLLKRRTHDKQITEYTYEPERDLATRIRNSTNPDDGKPKDTSYTYTSRGEVKTETKGNKNVVTKDYNLDGSVASDVEKKSDGTVVNQHTYEYAANGQKSKDTAHKQNADNKSAYLDTTKTYEYDPQDRIRKSTKTGSGAGTESYVHDANSNVIEQTVGGTTTTFKYSKNRLTSASALGVSSSYDYDPYGRLKTVTAQGIQLESYEYDGFDRTTKHTTNPGGDVTTYKYDPLDRQVQRTHGGKTTDMVYLGLTEELSAELEGTKVVKSYQHGAGGELLSQVKNNSDNTTEDSYTGYDGHSDVEQITDDKGDGRATYGYTAYGKNDAGQFTGADKADASDKPDPDRTPYNSYRFNGKRFDQSTGDYDMGFRDYDPGINQFLSRDSYNGALDDLGLAADPYTGNRYAFAGGNPISNVELDGHNWLSDAADKVGNFVKDAAGAIGSDGKDAATGIAQVAYDTAVGGNPLVSKETSDAAKGRAKERGEGLKKTLSNPGQAVQDWSDRLTADVKSGHPGAAAGHLLFDAFSIAAGGGGGGAAKAGAAGKTAGAAGKAGKAGDAARAGGAADSAGSRLTASVGKDCVGNSFLPGTAVLLADGSQKAIENVTLGDKVLASDPENGDTEGRPVIRRITGNGTKHLVDVTIDTDGDKGDATATVTATAGHPFWVDERGDWIDAGDLQPGDTVTTPAGKHLAVVATHAYQKVQRVYNLTVDGIHTYYVLAGTKPVLVHNCGSNFAPGKAQSHYDKHVLGKMPNGSSKPGGADMPEFLDKSDYVSGARDLLDGPAGNGVLEGTRGTDLLRYDTNSGAFGVKSADDIIRTFFRPDGGEGYFRGTPGLVPRNFS
ncbi:DNRLRE domain-containing protein [Actinoplanes sp. NPDC049596]|uniref:DNRLRE domain-containing protein n=1 Tax=unclassified Actinoplanes TaxID=2626549 RepID=UPI00342137B6